MNIMYNYLMPLWFIESKFIQKEKASNEDKTANQYLLR